MDFEKILNKVSKLKVLVIGDAMLDVYTICEPLHLSNEAPIPVLREKFEENKLGGAANLAHNVVQLTSHVDLLYTSASDDEGLFLQHALEQAKIHAIPYLNDSAPTILKNRIVDQQMRQICRLDTEADAKNYNIPLEEFSKLFRPENYDLIIVSDYAKGVITQEIFDYIRTTAKDKIVAVDPKPKNKINYHDADLLKPNLSEAMALSGLTKKMLTNVDVYQQNKKIFRAVIEKQQVKNLVITLGIDGMLIPDKTETCKQVYGCPQDLYDACGAGDTAMAVLATVFAAGFDLESAADLACVAAALVVTYPGTTVLRKSIFPTVENL